MSLLYRVVLFYKQKTAYEMRISDWSSDVCSSDLHVQAPAATRARERLPPVSPAMPAPEAAMPRKAYLVSSRATFREFSGLARPRGLHRDPSGTNLVISEIDATRLEDVAGIVHRTEQRCGGFFAFQTREEAEAFLRRKSTRL